MSPDVLVIDDDAAIKALIAQALREEGFEVHTAANGAEALQAISGRCPDAVVLDLEMPVMDGRTFYHHLRADGACACPVIILSAGGARRAQRELEAEAAIAKPFDLDELVDTVSRFAGRPHPSVIADRQTG